ncbi:Eukaryotic translation initiation factor 3 subunit I [Asimina triloba]
MLLYGKFFSIFDSSTWVFELERSSSAFSVQSLVFECYLPAAKEEEDEADFDELMKGHERPLTFLKYNREGDLLFSCAKDHTPTVWFADNGERLGTYRGHNGAVWCCDVSRDSMRLITGSADQSAKLWNVQTGTQLYSFIFDSPARSADFSVGDKLAVITTDPFMEQTSAIHVERITKDPKTGESVLTIRGPQGRINGAVWGPLNKTIISGGEDSVVRIWDSELWDIRTLTLVKTYVTERPVNACAISPLLDHVVIGGGQDASLVTTTDCRAGKFEAKFFHKSLQEEIGVVKGHFGPINALAFNPDGRSFSSGGEDGYVRLHHFDSDYFNIKM